jgi:predicted phage terminase large subunit-like protein
MNDIMPDTLKAILREDLIAFITKGFRFLNPNANFSSSWYVEHLAYELLQTQTGGSQLMTISIPPRHGKSTIVSVIWPAWCLGRNPTMRILCASYGQELAYKLGGEFRKLVESDWYRGVFPEVVINPAKCSEREVQTLANGGRFSTSVGSALTGIGGDMLIFDDLIKAEDATSAKMRESTMGWLRDTALSRLDNKAKGVIIVVGQRLHLDDPIGQLVSGGGWHEVRLPAIAEDATVHKLARWQGSVECTRSPGEPLDHNREGLEVLERQRALMGAAKFNAQYQQRPEYEQDTALRWQWFRRYDSLPKFDFLFLSLDPAIATTMTADWSVCHVIGVLGGDNYIVDVCRARMSFNDLLVKVDQLAIHHRADSILIETNGIGTSLAQELIKQGRHTVEHYSPCSDKLSRAYDVAPQIELGHVLVPSEAPWLSEFRKEMMAFPDGHHDDQVDALTQFLLYRERLIQRAMPRRVHMRGESAARDYGVAQGGVTFVGRRPSYWDRMRYH